MTWSHRRPAPSLRGRANAPLIENLIKGIGTAGVDAWHAIEAADPIAAFNRNMDVLREALPESWLHAMGLSRPGSPVQPAPGVLSPAPYWGTPAEKALLQSISKGESGGRNPYAELYGGGALKGLPTDQYGFPLWGGQDGAIRN